MLILSYLLKVLNINALPTRCSHNVSEKYTMIKDFLCENSYIGIMFDFLWYWIDRN